MSWMQRPRDVSEQLLEYAESGRLVAIVDETRRRRNPLVLFVVVAALVSATLGALFVGVATSENGSPALLVGCVVIAIGGLLALVAAAGTIHARAANQDRLDIGPGAVLPPDLVRVGNWIHRAGAWVRVDEVGRDGGGRVNVLISTGEIVHLDAPVTVAGGQFRPSVDPVASLRS